MRARILVSDAETATALAVVRSLGRAGHRAGVLAWSPHAAAAASRYSRRAVRVPRPDLRPEEWTETLVRTVHRSGWDLFLPVTDTAMILADRARDRLRGRVRCAMPDPEPLAVLLDKLAVLDRASAAGVPVLSRFAGERLESATIPAVVKPRRSRALGFRRVHGATARIVSDRRSLLAEVDRLERLGLGAYAEPWIPGGGTGVFLLRAGGRTLARFAHRRVREASPLGGPSAVAESAELDPDLCRHAEALADALEVEGPMMAEFRGSPGRWFLLEVNARFWGSLGLATAAGVDFPALYVAALFGEEPAAPSGYSIGVRRRNLGFDLRRALVSVGGRPRGAAPPWPGRFETVADLLLRGAPGLFLDRDDPAPARACALHLLRTAVSHE